jgi:hypothetical protein
LRRARRRAAGTHDFVNALTHMRALHHLHYLLPMRALAFLACVGFTSAALPPLPPSLRSRLSSRVAAWPPAPTLTPPSAPGDAIPPPPLPAVLRCSPLDFGGDPFGVNDSAAALQACVKVCVNYSVQIDALGHFPGDASFNNGRYIADAGGCTIDLGGAAWMISSPILIPEYIGNMVLGHGSLIADNTGVFPAESFLIQVGIAGSCKVPQGSCNVDLAFPELFLDGRHVASGIQINNVMGTTVGPAAYFLNFSAYGMQVNAGHEVMLDRAWLGESNFDHPWTQANPPQSIAIQINGNDHYILNTVVFSSKIGLEVNGAANRIDGVHVWFPDNQAVRRRGGGDCLRAGLLPPASCCAARNEIRPPARSASRPLLVSVCRQGRHGLSHHRRPEPLHGLLH